MGDDQSPQSSPCLSWAGYCNSDGYGQRRHNGKLAYVHRIAYCDAHGLTLDDIKGQLVRHKCDNRKCMNPEHLEIGTNQDNSSDMVQRARQARGVGHANATLTDQQVQHIRNTSATSADLSVEYNVTVRTINQIRSRQTWRHLA